MPYHAHSFVDGAYLLEAARSDKIQWPNPALLSRNVVGHGDVQEWGRYRASDTTTVISRVRFYDGVPDGGAEADREKYWRSIELLPHTDLGFGAVRKSIGRRVPRQKGVDTLVAVDMLVGAFSELFNVAVLIAGDADWLGPRF